MAVAFIGAWTVHPATWSSLVTAAAAPVTPDALATSTGTFRPWRLGGVVVVVVVGPAVGSWSLSDVVVGAAAARGRQASAVWIWPSRSTVARTNSPSRMTARSTGNRWPPNAPGRWVRRAPRDRPLPSACRHAGEEKQALRCRRRGPYTVAGSRRHGGTPV